MTVAYHWHVLCNIPHVWIPCDSFHVWHCLELPQHAFDWHCFSMNRMMIECDIFFRMTYILFPCDDDSHLIPYNLADWRFAWCTILFSCNRIFPWTFNRAWCTLIFHAIWLSDDSHDEHPFRMQFDCLTNSMMFYLSHAIACILHCFSMMNTIHWLTMPCDPIVQFRRSFGFSMFCIDHSQSHGWWITCLNFLPFRW